LHRDNCHASRASRAAGFETVVDGAVTVTVAFPPQNDAAERKGRCQLTTVNFLPIADTKLTIVN